MLQRNYEFYMKMFYNKKKKVYTSKIYKKSNSINITNKQIELLMKKKKQIKV